MSDYLDPANEELLKDFFEEAESQIEVLEQNLLLLENEPDNHDAIDEIFRAAHTLKGGSATVEMNEISDFTHLMEDVLDEIRSGNLKVTPDIVDSLLTALDVIKGMLEARINGDIYKEDISSIKNTFLNYLKIKEHVSESGETKSGRETNVEEGISLDEMAGIKGPLYHVIVSFNKDYVMNTVGGIQVYAALKDIGKIVKTVPDFDSLYEDRFYPEVEYFVESTAEQGEIEKACAIPEVTLSVNVEKISDKKAEKSQEPEGEKILESKTAREPEEAKETEEIEETKRAEETPERADSEKKSGTEKPLVRKPVKHGSILRVDSKRVDNLLNLVSETVINKATFNQVVSIFTENILEFQNTVSNYRERLKDLFDLLGKSTGNGSSEKLSKKYINESFNDLFNIFDDYGSHIKNTFNLFRNTTQQLSRITGDLQEGVMQIRMVPVSQIFSRFPRLVRDLSRNLKKKIRLEIEGEDTELDKSVIEDLLDPLIHCVRNSIDHGIESPEERLKNGKEPEGRVFLKARNEGNMIVIEVSDNGRGIDVESVKRRAVERGLIHPNKALTDIEAFNLIFQPGFSTADKVTNISGRGVGLDVVRKQVEKLNGSVSVNSVKGEGTTFTIKLPLTLAIVQGLLVQVGKEIYAIPITSVIESVRIKPDEIRTLDSYEVFDLRDEVLSLMRLNRLFRISSEESNKYLFVVVVGSGEKKVGLVVDNLIGEEDLVIKPLRDRFTNSPGIAGATILGDGRVALILDVNQLLEFGMKLNE